MDIAENQDSPKSPSTHFVVIVAQAIELKKNLQTHCAKIVAYLQHQVFPTASSHRPTPLLEAERAQTTITSSSTASDLFADWVQLVAQIYCTTQITEILHSNVLRLGGSALAQQSDVHREKCGRNTMTRNPGRIRELCKTVTPETDQSQR